MLGMLVPLVDAVELTWWQVVDLHPRLDGESFVAVVGVMVEKPSVART